MAAEGNCLRHLGVLLGLAVAAVSSPAALAQTAPLVPPPAASPPALPPQMQAPPVRQARNDAAPDEAKAEAAPGQTHPAAGTKVYFVDLKEGQQLPGRFTIHFGLKGMGIAPAGTERPNTGHHHLIIDAELPPRGEPIPNDFNHLHFGAGQTEAEVELTPGDHSLQLLFGDKDHYSFDPPVASDRIVVHVGDEASVAENEVDANGVYKAKASAPNASVYFEEPYDGAVVPPTFNVKFGLKGMGVAPAGVSKAYTGHHHLLVDVAVPPADQPIPNDFNHYHFGQGQTEAQITLAPGVHTLQLMLGDANHYAHQPMVLSRQIKVFVRVPTVAVKHYMRWRRG